MRRRDGRLRHHLPDQSVSPRARERAGKDGGRRHEAAATDERAEPARQIEAGEDRVARRRGDPARRHDDGAETAGELDHLADDRRAFDLVGVEDRFVRFAPQDGGELPGRD